ncbi:MAG: cell division protein FtsA [Alphaproteobacteria bacterium]
MVFKHKPKGSLLAALDIGSSKIACFIGRVADNEGTFEVLGVGHHASAGVRNGTISDLNAAENAIRQTVHAAENMAADVMKGYPLREVVVNLPGIHAVSHTQTADIQVMGHEITDTDLQRALARTQEQIRTDNFELIHTIPVDYQVDGHSGIREPRGMYGHDMSMDIHLVTGDMASLQNIATCIERSHLEVSSFCVSAYAAGLACLVDDEMDLGCTVIDIGAGVTSFAVFHGGALIWLDALALGGQHVTSDIAKGLMTTMANAERLKILYGSAMASPADASELIDVPRIGEDDRHGPNHVPRSLLVGIMQPRLEEIFEIVRARLSDSGLGPILGRRVVLTGGSSQILGLKELGQHVMDKQIRLGRPIRLSGLPDAVSGPGFATTAGLLTYVSERSHEMSAQVMAQAPPASLWERVQFWLRDNW